MSSRTGSNHPGEVTSCYNRKRRTAYALGLVFLAHEAAGSHVAHFAACALVTDGARFHPFRSFEGGLELFLTGGLEQGLRCRIN
jgi:hypothetical protein